MTTNILTSFLFIIIIISCSNNNNNYSDKFNKTSDSINVVENMEINQKISGKIFKVKDSSLYSPKFIMELRNLNSIYESAIVIDDKLYLKTISSNGEKNIRTIDTITFPLELPLNILVKYKAEKNNKNYLLEVKRINFTNIYYEFKINNHTLKTGLAILPATFYFAAEASEDENGYGYFLRKYYDNIDCNTSIGIEIGGLKNRAEYSVTCDKDKSKEINDIPILKKE
jgi:hypothetical protein